MYKIKSLITATLISSMFALSACSQTDTAKAKKTAEATCENIIQVEQAYLILKDSGQVSNNTQIKADAAFKSAHVFCSSVSSYEPETALVSAALLFVRVSQIYKDAKS